MSKTNPVSKISDLPEESKFRPGHRLCAGCGPAITAKLITLAVPEAIIVNATGCVEVGTTIYPYSAWKTPWVHVLFQNNAPVASGIAAALEKLSAEGRAKKLPVIALGGDGATFDIGLGAISGALERLDKIIYICYDNEAYMNTGIQRSGASILGSATTTSPAGRVIPGKQENKKDLIGIVASHHIPYAATATIWLWRDMVNKIRKAVNYSEQGPAFLHILAPCQFGWRYEPHLTVKISRMAVETRLFPIYEVEDGQLKINFRVSKPAPVEEYLKIQRRTRHLLESRNAETLQRLKAWIEWNWLRLENLEKAGKVF
ncbi:MAG: pyruvate ferredoxin oxidoreductase [Candidatus Brockarchaeota archaeon]|nr:pyruvate ferredoxin oxidoreductase [Candidatus Brockarchaeota archaeon]